MMNRRKGRLMRVVHSYNQAKCGIDLSDQMASYVTSLRKSERWYGKLATEFLLLDRVQSGDASKN